jgi:hypothetical protein
VKHCGMPLPLRASAACRVCVCVMCVCVCVCVCVCCVYLMYTCRSCTSVLLLILLNYEFAHLEYLEFAHPLFCLSVLCAVPALAGGCWWWWCLWLWLWCGFYAYIICIILLQSSRKARKHVGLTSDAGVSCTRHTLEDRLSGDSRRETTHTKDTTSPPAPDAPAPGVEPPNERQAASPPEPKNLNLTDDHLRPVLANATTGEPPYPYLHPSLTHVQQDDLSFQPIFPTIPTSTKRRERAICPLCFPLERKSIPVSIRSTLFPAHTSALGQST